MATTRRWVKISAGVAASITTILGFFALLTVLYNFSIIDLTGNFSCVGTYENPCISEFEVRNPNPYVVDVYSKDQVKLDFSPDIKDYALFVPDGRCTATGKCACTLKNGQKLGFEDWRCVDFTNATKPRADKEYNFRFDAYSRTKFRLAGIKNNPKDVVKWGFGVNNSYLDPVWLGESQFYYGIQTGGSGDTRNLDNTIKAISGLYQYEANNGEYKVQFKSEANQPELVRYERNGTNITLQPHALNYRNALGSVELISQIQKVNATPLETSMIYPNAFGEGLSIRYDVLNSIIKNDLIINRRSNLPNPSTSILQGGNVTLDFDFIISGDGRIFVGKTEYTGNGNQRIRTPQEVQVRDGTGRTIYKLPKAVSYDFAGTRQVSEYEIHKSGNNKMVTIKTPYSWLDNRSTIYPVEIDPTVTVSGSITGITGEVNITISPVNATQSFVLISRAAPGTNPDAQVNALYFTPIFYNSTTLGLRNGGANQTGGVTRWQIISDEQIYTQSGETGFSTGTEFLVNLSRSVNISKAFIIAYSRSTGTVTSGHRMEFTAEFMNASRINMTRGQGITDVNVYWQVVEWEGAIVQNQSVYTASNWTTGANIHNINPVNLSASFIVRGTSSTSNAGDRYLSDVMFFNSTQVISAIDGAIGNSKISWFVVSHPRFNVQNGMKSFTATTAQQDQTINPINTSSSFLVSHFSTNSANAQNSRFQTLSWITNETNIAFQKLTSPDLSNNTWWVVDVMPPSGTSCAYTSGNWNVACGDNCVITDNVVIDTNANISIIGTGTFTTTANITGYFRLFTQGKDSSNQCVVRSLNGGRFRGN